MEMEYYGEIRCKIGLAINKQCSRLTMNALTITSDTQHQIKPLLETAIENEIRLLEAGLRKTMSNLKAFEDTYKMTTSEFLMKYENDEIEELADFENWVGESRLVDRINDKIKALRSIRIEN
jgi:nucleosome binding factor SPN SPT16 subunit